MNLKTTQGHTIFTGMVAIAAKGFTIDLVDGEYIAVDKKGKQLGTIVGDTVTGDPSFKHTDAGKEFKLADLKPAIDPASLIGKDPTTLSKEELVVLTSYLQGLAGAKAAVDDADDAKASTKEKASEKAGKGKKKAKAKEEVVEETVEEDEDEEEVTIELPDGVETAEDLKKLGVKELYAIIKPAGLEGITSRTKKGELIAAIVEFFEIGEDDEDEEELEGELGEEVTDSDDEESDDDSEEDEEEYDDDEEEDEEEEEDDDDEEEEDEDEEEFEEDEEDDEDEEELTPEDIDNLSSKEEIMEVIREYDIKLPGKKLSVRKVKEFIKEALFGDDE